MGARQEIKPQAPSPSPPRSLTQTPSSTMHIPTWLCWATNIFGQLSVVCFSGIIFGWAPLELILLREGQYSELCVAIHNGTTAASFSDDGVSRMDCSEQTNTLFGMFTLAQFWLSFASLPVGYILDRLPKSTVLSLCAVIQITGLLLFAISESNDHHEATLGADGFGQSTSATNRSAAGGDYFALAYSLMGIGGCMTMLSSFPATFLLLQAQTLLLAACSCLFDASSVVFFVFEVLQEKFGVQRRLLFAAYAMWALVVYSTLIACWIVLERRDWKGFVKSHNAVDAAKEAGHREPNNGKNDDENNEDRNAIQRQQLQHNSSLPTETVPLIAEAQHSEDIVVVTRIQRKPKQTQKVPHQHRQQQHKQSRDGKVRRVQVDPHVVWIERRGIQRLPVGEQMQTYDFGLALIFASVHMMRSNFFIMTVDDLLLHYGDVTSKYAKIFSWVLPCGVIFVPWIERTASMLGIHGMIHVANGLGVIFGVILCIPSLNVQVGNFVLFTAFRAYLYATLNTFLAMTFGVETMGRTLGCVFTTAAVFTLVQYPLAVWTESYADGKYSYVNSMLVLVCALPIYCAHLYSRMSHADQGDGIDASILGEYENTHDVESSYGSVDLDVDSDE